MSELQRILEVIDKIDDDEDWMAAEHDAVRDYCAEHDFNLSENDMSIIRARGLEGCFDDWVGNRESILENPKANASGS